MWTFIVFLSSYSPIKHWLVVSVSQTDENHSISSQVFKTTSGKAWIQLSTLIDSAELPERISPVSTDSMEFSFAAEQKHQGRIVYSGSLDLKKRTREFQHLTHWSLKPDNKKTWKLCSYPLEFTSFASNRGSYCIYASAMLLYSGDSELERGLFHPNGEFQ